MPNAGSVCAYLRSVCKVPVDSLLLCRLCPHHLCHLLCHLLHHPCCRLSRSDFHLSPHGIIPCWFGVAWWFPLIMLFIKFFIKRFSFFFVEQTMIAWCLRPSDDVRLGDVLLLQLFSVLLFQTDLIKAWWGYKMSHKIWKTVIFFKYNKNFQISPPNEVEN